MARKRQIAKLVTSTIVLITLGVIILVGRKQPLIAEKKNDHTYVFNPALTPVYTNVSDYGATVAQNNRTISKATVEHIALHVPKKANSDEKIVRYGRLVRYPKAEATILICHGFMCDKFDVGFLRHMFPQGKYNFMTFDFRAHGENTEGQRCTFGRDESLDVITAAYFIKNHQAIKDLPILVYGFSMGAVAAIEAQSKDPSLFAAMVLDCPFDSSENIIRRCLENIQFSFLGYDFSVPACSILQKYAFHPYVQSMIKNLLKAVANLDAKNIDFRMYPLNPAQSAEGLRVPVMLIHCKNDEKVSVDSIKAVYNNVGSDYKELWLTNGRRHFDSYFYNPEKYIKEVRGFIDKVVAGSVKDLHLNKVIEDPDEVLAQI